eukprot:CAMPEP_0174897722 /NCGR_PEP_ID=MMETSP0167-20121228/16166_1 /TAXON_ID=38298 /ORGANISM="Rhodella maculata, Strain CCMP736" /LENGTH=79 /DNA_ID=CAMNT_0016137913 /DNA_START=196 /DNA_END=432 /DNA_ORIENTATION=-
MTLVFLVILLVALFTTAHLAAPMTRSCCFSGFGEAPVAVSCGLDPPVADFLAVRHRYNVSGLGNLVFGYGVAGEVTVEI